MTSTALTGTVDADGVYRLSPVELAAGMLFGYDLGWAHERSHAGLSPSAVLECLLTDALRHPPCAVAFSGGRDSSAMLALAVDAARRHGLELPVPVTRRYAGDPGADEREWQELVIRHLGVSQWVRIDVAGECDLLGPHAARLLRRFGVLWPPTAHVMNPVLELVRGGSIVTGEGGDEVFGPRRATPLRHLAGGPRRRRAALRHLPTSVGPQPLRRHLRRRVAVHQPWLTATGRVAIASQRVAHELAEPLSWRRSTLALGRRRAWLAGAATLQLVADLYGVALHHPLMHPRFLSAYARHGTVVGPLTRSAAMRELFGHLLPDDVLRRRTKAAFNTTLFGEHSRGFADRWDGRGVDTALVYPAGLAATWREKVPDGRTFALLQSVWLRDAEVT